MLKRYHALKLIKEIFGTKHGCEEKKWQGTNQINNCAIILLFECVSTASITFIELRLSPIISKSEMGYDREYFLKNITVMCKLIGILFYMHF